MSAMLRRLARAASAPVTRPPRPLARIGTETSNSARDVVESQYGVPNDQSALRSSESQSRGSETVRTLVELVATTCPCKSSTNSSE